MSWLLHWLAVHTGSSNTPGAPPNYNFWSGIGSDIGEVAIIGGMITMVRKHNCHQARCWRVGRHVVDGTPWCNRHHQAARENDGTQASSEREAK